MKLITLDPQTKLPALPEGMFWKVEQVYETRKSVWLGMRYLHLPRIELVEGSVSRNSFTLHKVLAYRKVQKKWHWMVRYAAVRIYLSRFKDGEFVPYVPKEAWDARYDVIQNHRLEIGSN